MSTPKKVEIKKIFSERVRLLIGDESVNGFSKRMGLKQPAVDRYIKEKNSPAADAIVAIAIGCGVTSDWLLGLSELRDSGVSVTATGGSAAAGNNSTATVNGGAEISRLLGIIESQQRVIESLTAGKGQP